MLAWFWLAISASALWGLTYVASQYILKSIGALEILWLNSLMICVGLGMYLLATGHGKLLFTRLTNPKLVLTVIIYAGLYFIASVMILKSINFGNATLAALVESSYPLFTLVFSYVFLKQIQFNGGILVGCGFLVAGLILIQLYSSELLK